MPKRLTPPLPFRAVPETGKDGAKKKEVEKRKSAAAAAAAAAAGIKWPSTETNWTATQPKEGGGFF